MLATVKPSHIFRRWALRTEHHKGLHLGRLGLTVKAFQKEALQLIIQKGPII
jgi:hypothetical protein